MRRALHAGLEPLICALISAFRIAIC